MFFTGDGIGSSKTCVGRKQARVHVPRVGERLANDIAARRAVEAYAQENAAAGYDSEFRPHLKRFHVHIIPVCSPVLPANV